MANKTKELRVVLILTVDESVQPEDIIVGESDGVDGFELFRDNNKNYDFLIEDCSIIVVEENK